MRERFAIGPERYAQIALAALIVLTLIVLTGTAVRLTGSGLGCPTWPSCTETQLHAPLTTHGIIEFGNRLLTGVVGLPCLLAAFFAFFRRPFRRDLLVLALLLPLGVLAQAVLGGITVLYGLAPETVMAHFMLSMLLLIAAVALYWRATRAPDELPVSADRPLVWATRALAAYGLLVIFVGTAATAAGPLTGGEGTGDLVPRLDFRGAETMDWLIRNHARLAAVLGVGAVALWLAQRRRGATAQQRRAVFWVCWLVAAQGVVGTTQYLLELPAELVWVHILLAALTWLALLWAVAAAGRAGEPATQPAAPERTAPAPASRRAAAPTPGR